MIKRLIYSIVLFYTPVALAETTIMSREGVKVKIGGNIEYEFVDVEGEGGFKAQEGSTLRPDQRSPYIKMDEASIKMDVEFSEDVSLYLKYKFSDSSANIDINVLKVNFPELGLKLELGRDYPIIRTKRKTESYPLIATAYWRGKENHLALFKNFGDQDGLNFKLGLSIGPKRQFGESKVGEDSSFKMLVYDDFEPTDGQSEVYGVDLKARYDAFLAEAWFFYGRLIDDFDWKTNLSQAIEDYDDLGDPSDKTHQWYGGRFEYNANSIHFRTEMIVSKDGLLERQGQYTQASYTLKEIMGLEKLEILARYDILNILDIRAVNGNSITWDREMTTIAFLANHTKLIKSKIEYNIMDETTGDRDTNSPVVNNEFVYQLNVSF